METLSKNKHIYAEKAGCCGGDTNDGGEGECVVIDDCGTGGDCDGSGSDSGGDVTDDDGNGCGGDTNVDGEGECDVTNDCNAVGDCDGGGVDRRRRFACKCRRMSFGARGGVIRAGLFRFRVDICMKYIGYCTAMKGATYIYTLTTYGENYIL